ncbi:enolase C-terminal domain-like protein [Gammaproteobacteria bacterium]|nr:enolase C-terminal domain-like protein [Gammaproteobacteria bacterium]
MKITRLTLWHVPLTSHTAYYMSDGKTCDTVTSVIVRVETDSAISGWGEVCPIPHYLPAYAEGVLPALQYLTPQLIGADPLGSDALMGRLDAYLLGHPFVKSLLDIAFWDITGQVAGLPLYTLFGGRQVSDMPLYHSITCIAPDDMAAIAKDAYASGIRQLQVKLGASGDWQTDVERLIAVREAVGAGPLVYGDWNCGATLLDAKRVARAVAHLDIMLEQPCKTIEQCAEVRQTAGLPMKLDELAHDSATLIRGAELGCMDAVAIKLSKFGGLSASRRARDLCLHLGAKMCVEDVWGSDIVTAALLHLAASTPPQMLMNCCDLSGYVSPRVAPQAPSRDHGRIAPPQGIGLGIRIDADRLGNPLAVID